MKRPIWREGRWRWKCDEPRCRWEIENPTFVGTILSLREHMKDRHQALGHATRQVAFADTQLRGFTDWQIGALTAGLERLYDAVAEEPGEYDYTADDIQTALDGLTLESWRREEEKN